MGRTFRITVFLFVCKSVIGRVYAEDPDGSPVTYKLEGEGFEFFQIHPDTGVVTLKKLIDYDTRSDKQITMRIILKDGQGEEASAPAKVFLEDVNDERPVFDSAAQFKAISEDELPGFDVAIVSVSDVDTRVNTSNNRLSVECVGDTERKRDACEKFGLQFVPRDVSNKFWRGKVVLLQKLDYEERISYVIELRASDGVQTSTQEVHVEVEDINDTPPRWVISNDRTIKEELPLLLRWSRKLLGARLFAKLMRYTFYGHFVAGENEDEIKPVATRIREFGVKSILDYSAEEDISSEQAVEAEMEGCAPVALQEELEASDAETKAKFRAHQEFGDRREGVSSARTYFYEGEAQCDKNMEIFLNCIDAVSHATEKSGFAAIKLTALGKPQLLMAMSEVLTTVQNFFKLLKKEEGIIDRGDLRFSLEDFDSRLADIGVEFKSGEKRTWVSVKDISHQGIEVDLLDWSNLLEINRSLSRLLMVPNFKTGTVHPLVDAMTEEEEEQMKNMLRRVNKLAQYAKEKEVRVMIDAEQSYFQPAIRRLTMEMMRKFNKERSVIFNTYQNYAKEAYNEIVVDMDLARTEDFYFGAKLVRGAYMDQERERAAKLGYEDPINPSYDATTDMMHRVIEEVMRQIHLRPVGKMAVMIASHNEDTIRYTIKKMKEYGIGPDDRLICFGQLFGMCDQISFPLGQAGYSVYKYVPFGPVEEVLPYLSRRAIENKGVLAKVKKEKRLLRKELTRRLLSGNTRYKPLPSSG